MTLPDPQTSVAATAAKEVDSRKNEAINGRMGYCYMSLNEASNVCLVDSSPSPVDFFEAKERSMYNILICKLQAELLKHKKIPFFSDNFEGLETKATYFADEVLENGDVKLTGYFSLPKDSDGKPSMQ